MTILQATTHWTCPNCPSELMIPASAQPVMHPCRGLFGLVAPMVRAGTKCEVRLIEREDYIGTETADRHMAVVTERDDGRDVAVFAPLATGQGSI